MPQKLYPIHRALKVHFSIGKTKIDFLDVMQVIQFTSNKQCLATHALKSTKIWSQMHEPRIFNQEVNTHPDILLFRKSQRQSCSTSDLCNLQEYFYYSRMKTTKLHTLSLLSRFFKLLGNLNLISTQLVAEYNLSLQSTKNRNPLTTIGQASIALITSQAK